ncbi:dihydrolipoyl dehydrogenase [Prevotella fusca JCM 17724]|uniref:Dihydrolipoyl dehydrogenase n=1 Tax=Prevotella fusca JCM 17724 TaxID=1236517 RepID=A0A0K1NLV1_9BACT|nr:dihydrolipoyl dehydrogenase [Prevotella fusca]AKU69873.1 dihydrolipoyl dehydrogenase [Prevotella fusca JCM 17724]QUB85485.1 dihydrolipoyl dehydrogenase [Prevotella fusca JCM 17724]
MKKTNLLIIGSGPGGYRTASYAAQNGLEVTIIEKAQPGGTCLNAGCIPTKCLAHDAEMLLIAASHYNTTPPLDFTKVMERKEGVISQLRDGVSSLLNQPGINLIKGEARFVSDHIVEVNGEQIEAENIIIATGSRSKMPPFMSEEDFTNQSETTKNIVTSTELLSIPSIPQRLTIIGAGVIGMEFASAFSAFGSEVTVIEFMKECLPPIDSDIAKRLRKTLEKRGVTFYMQSAVNQIISTSENGEHCTTVLFERKGKEEKVETDLVLIATGRQANVENIGLESAGIAFSQKGIMVNENMETNVKGVYAIGDVNGRQMLAHAATFQGFRAVNHILDKKDHIRLDIMPSAIFTYPEAACVGKTEDQCKTQNIKFTTRKGFYRANGKALSMEETEGMIKILVGEDGSILGAHAYGAHSADLIQEVSALMNRDAKLDEIRDIIHIHPTLSEILQDALI